jgi:dienelactone hydrolase
MAIAHPELLSPPVARAAYSDRTAWLMAEMSRLAYVRFENSDEKLEQVVAKLKGSTNEKEIRKLVSRYAQLTVQPDEAGLKQLTDGLADFDFELVATFNNGGTQAFLAKRDSDLMAVLAFRGTEPDALVDIKTDLNARFYKDKGAKIHDGFRQAFNLVHSFIDDKLELVQGYKLYITGHSLGGALAKVAANVFSADNVAACYTFGSPKVGNLDFGDNMKIPVYRLVNAADAVPRVPPTWVLEFLVWLIKKMPIPWVRTWLVKLLDNFRGYRHHGDMRYLSACKDDFKDLRLYANPEFFDRAGWMVERIVTNWGAGFSDHSITEYCRKLEAYAIRRLRAK